MATSSQRRSVQTSELDEQNARQAESQTRDKGKARVIGDMGDGGDNTNLKQNPERIELGVSNTRQRPSSRRTTGVQISDRGTRHHSVDRMTSKGGEGKQDQYEENDESEIYCSWDSFLNDNDSLMSLLYKNPDPIFPEMKAKPGFVGFKEHFTQLFKDLGPEAHMVVDNKPRSEETEASDSRTQTGTEDGGDGRAYHFDSIPLDRMQDAQSIATHANRLAPAEEFTLRGTGSVSQSSRGTNIDLNLTPPDAL